MGCLLSTLRWLLSAFVKAFVVAIVNISVYVYLPSRYHKMTANQLIINIVDVLIH